MVSSPVVEPTPVVEPVEAPQTSPRTKCPWASTSNGSPPAGTGRSAIRGGAANQSFRATRPVHVGTTCSPYRKNAFAASFLKRTIVLLSNAAIAVVSYLGDLWSVYVG